MIFRCFTFRSLCLFVVVTACAAASSGTAEACHPTTTVVYAPVQHVYVRPAPVRKVMVVQPAPIYRPSCY